MNTTTKLVGKFTIKDRDRHQTYHSEVSPVLQPPSLPDPSKPSFEGQNCAKWTILMKLLEIT